MPMDEARYPANWREIARQVKEAAGWWCQGCGKMCRQLILEERNQYSDVCLCSGLETFKDVYDTYFVRRELPDCYSYTSELRALRVFTPFKPTANADHPILDGVNIDDIPSLGAFCHCKLKEGAEAVLMGPYSPIYAVHSYGKGKVGSFMCDLSGVFSQEFINSEVGRKIINNIIKDLIS